MKLLNFSLVAAAVLSISTAAYAKDDPAQKPEQSRTTISLASWTKLKQPRLFKAQYLPAVTCFATNNFGGVWTWTGPNEYTARSYALRLCSVNTPVGGTCWIDHCQ